MRRRTPETSGPRHALVASYLALFLALSGAAWAAATIGSDDVVNNSLRSADLKNNAAVKSPDVRDRSLGGADVRNNSIAGAEFRANSVGGADLREPSLLIGRIFHRLGGPVNQPVTGALVDKAVPNNSFTQGADESDLIFGTAQVTFSAACATPRQFVGYLLLDSPTTTAETIIGSFTKVETAGAGATTSRVALGASPVNIKGPSLFRTGAAEPHQFFVSAAGGCSAGSGITLDSVDLQVVGHR
jgi:hypothetical protein